jgi:GNAT superfamily N-acetyltransferase
MDNSKFENIEFRFIKDWPLNDIVDLYKCGGWWLDSYNPHGIPSVINGSFAFLIAYDKASEHAVGMGRVISDGVSDAYIQDVVVLKSYRGKGIGVKIVQELLDYCLSNKLQWIGLVAEPGTKSFYEQFGFKTLPGEPMVYKSEE